MAKIQPGLERITALLKDVDFPWRSIHVAGTNGKGSICHYASSLMVGRSIKTGKFTSPHLVDRCVSSQVDCVGTDMCRWDCISINGQPVAESKFRVVERHFQKKNADQQIGASPFEILTATAFTIFNDAKVKVGIVEVGMGGRLDTTNILNNQAVSVISKIARDHEGFLGNTLAEIAGHKAGILRPSIPYIVNSANEANVQTVIQDYAQEIGAGPRLNVTDFELTKRLYETNKWQRVIQNLAPFQEENLKMAVTAVLQTLYSMDQGPQGALRDLSKTLIANAKNHHHGRQEFIRAAPVFRDPNERRNHILVDGAHNPDAATALDGFVRQTLRHGQSPAKERPSSGWPVTWVLAMTEGKDAHRYLATLLKPGDKVVATTFGPVDGMPWVKPMDPKKLLEVAKSVQPEITGVHVPVMGPLRALCTAKYLSDQAAAWSPIVLTGSLYLVGDLHRELRSRPAKTWWTDTDEATTADRELFLNIQAEERERVSALLGSRQQGSGEPETPETEEQRKLQEELDALTREVQGLEVEEMRLAGDNSNTSGDVASLSAADRLVHEERRFAELHSTPEQLAAQIARAEKAESDLARHEKLLEIAQQERQARLDKRARQKERLEARRERRAERRRQLKKTTEEREARAEELHAYRRERGPVDLSRKVNIGEPRPEGKAHEYIQEAGSTSDKGRASLSSAPSAGKEDARGGDEKPQDALSILTANRTKTLSFGSIIPSEGDVTKDFSIHTHEAPASVSSQTESKNLFFGNSTSKSENATPTPTSADTSAVGNTGDALSSNAASRDPRDRLKTSAERYSHERRARRERFPKTHYVNFKPTTIKIHKHYANAAGPGKGKMKEPLDDRKNKAWFTQLSNKDTKYGMHGPNPTSYFKHDDSTKKGDNSGDPFGSD